MKVLIVDDSLFMRDHLKTLLAKHGYGTVEAADGEQAVSQYRSARPDAVLMDITMPHLDGLEALAQIRIIDPQARVVMLTALDQSLIAARAIHMGARDFLVKPVSPASLLASLQRALR